MRWFDAYDNDEESGILKIKSFLEGGGTFGELVSAFFFSLCFVFVLFFVFFL